METHIFLGDRHTTLELKNKACNTVKKLNGKCYRGRNANMLIDIDGVKYVVPGRRLRKLK